MPTVVDIETFRGLANIGIIYHKMSTMVDNSPIESNNLIGVSHL